MSFQLRTGGSVINIKDWSPDARVLQRLQGSGFEYFAGFDNDARCCRRLLKAMISSYDLHRRCFVFGDNNFCFGLEDIYYLTGLPIVGKPVSGTNYEDDQLCYDLLGKENYLRQTAKDKKNSIMLKTLRQDFEKVPENVEIEVLDRHVRAYVLYIIGSVISVDDLPGYVPAMYLKCLENVEEIGSFAWGAALLANINLWLHKCKKNVTSKYGMRAFAFLLQVSIDMN